jgi:hypothetical protein
VYEKFEDTKEAENQTTDNTMDGQTMIYRTLHKKQKNKTNSIKTEDEIRCFRRVSSSCSTSDTHHVTIVTNSGDKSRKRKERYCA